MSAETGSRRPDQGKPKGKRAAGSRPRPASAAVSRNGSGNGAKVTVMKPGSPAALEAQIQAKRDHLAATIDELSSRAAPKEIARRSVAGVQAKIRNATHTPEGQLRTERLAAVGAAVVALGTALIWIRRRR
jgi:Protein of unknown function (DUF3618)